jgi:hypothetical protein
MKLKKVKRRGWDNEKKFFEPQLLLATYVTPRLGFEPRSPKTQDLCGFIYTAWFLKDEKPLAILRSTRLCHRGKMI